MPTQVVVGLPQALCDPAFGFHAEHRRVHPFATVDLTDLRQRGQRREDGAARMHQRFEMSVVEIKNVRTDAVQESGMRRIHALSTADDRRLRGTGKFANRLPRSLHGAVGCSAQRAGNPVDQRSYGLMTNFIRDAARWNSGDEFGKLGGDSHCASGR